MAAVSVTSKGQVTIPKRVRKALGITTGTKVEFDVEGGGARLTVVKVAKPSDVSGGAAILGYSGPRVPIEELDGGVAMKKASKRARG
jgi:antitoxin PrlF